ncbi:MAG: hypothetical protein IKY83_12160 [Proteobacteria bacterium]|nr:hypothetical protein [Pseudomonadota bacterium]
MGKSEIRKKYDAENAMFEIQPLVRHKETDLRAVSLGAPIVWLIWGVSILIIRICGFL